ncbi:hypothetical protein K0U07_03615 [bacterium]|nr:hypothetical protein [bacterium]
MVCFKRLFLVLFPVLLFSDSTIVHNVDVLTGHFQYLIADHTVKGAKPLSLVRSQYYYDNQHAEDMFSRYMERHGVYPHLYLYLNRDRGDYEAYIYESNRGKTTYHRVKGKRNEVELAYGDAYASKGEKRSSVIGYRNNPKNNKLTIYRREKKAILRFADGTIRYYIKNGKSRDSGDKFHGYFWKLGYRYRLEKEVAANGEVTLFEYGDKSVKIKKVGPSSGIIFSWMKVSLEDRDWSLRLENGYKRSYNYDLKVETSDGKTFVYSGYMMNKLFYPSTCRKDSGLETEFLYHDHFSAGRQWFKGVKLGKELIAVEYYYPEEKKGERRSYYDRGKIKEVYKKGKKMGFFSYEDGCTTFIDQNRIVTKYFYKKEGLDKIQSSDMQGNVYTTQKFEWKGEHLVAKHLYDGEELVRSELFEYDKHHHVIKETVTDEKKSSFKWYRYNENHLCVEEKTEDQTITYEYVEGTDLLSCKSVGDVKEYFVYDEDYLLLEKRVVAGDQCKVERYIRDPQTKMIVEKDDGLCPVYYEYDSEKQLTKESTEFGAIQYEYDQEGRMVKKISPLGAESTYSYDSFGNLKSTKEPGAPRKKFTYNQQDQVLSCKFCKKESKNVYDEKGNLIEEINYKGAKTAYEYDEFDRCIKKVLPEVEIEGEYFLPTWEYEYDGCGNKIREISPLGNETTFSYDLCGRLLTTIFSDGEAVSNTYDHSGNVIEICYPQGGKVEYEYDSFGRCIIKKQGGIEEHWKYKGLLLDSYIDARGLTTYYYYDQHGRKIKEESEGRIKSYSYDKMGNLCKIEEMDVEAVESFDIEGRVIESSANGFHQTKYFYEEGGRKSKVVKTTSQGDAIDRFFYDKEGRLVKHVDPFGGELVYQYEDYATTKIDPLGNKEVQYFDSHDRLVCLEKLSSEGEVLFCEKNYYDLDGNVIKKVTQDLELEFFYDCMGRKIKQVESGGKETSFHYNGKGLLVAKTLPNGIELYYEYDALDRNVSMRSSDGSIDYVYVYEHLDLVEVKDVKAQKSLLRKYSRFGELIEEKGFFGRKTGWEYDLFGRKKALYLPDQSSIHYTYEKSSMVLVSRKNLEGETLYTHRYVTFDPNQHVEEEELPLNLGRVYSERDLMERPTLLHTPFHKIELSFNANHSVTKKCNSLLEDKEFDYDALSQLTKEGEEQYSFDALGNSEEFEINELNQIVASEDEVFTYDANGNLLSRKGIEYAYDALDRLVRISYECGRVVQFTYDPLSRLVAKEDSEKIYYLYDGASEIGTLSTSGAITQLKVLGLGVSGDIGAAIALELDGEVFIPIHDLQGNVLGIVNGEKEVVERYLMNAFGEESCKEYRNPWRFSSKRFEEGMYYFGMRFYDPGLKRWLTPDPAGFVDGRNLYLFNLNSPLNRLDLFGLASDAFYVTIPRYKNSKMSYAPYKHPPINSSIWPMPEISSPIAHKGTGHVGGRDMKMMIKLPNNYGHRITDVDRERGYYNAYDDVGSIFKAVGDKKTAAGVLVHNGMLHTEKDFTKVCMSVIDKAPKNSLTVGVYNETGGLSDLLRVGMGHFLGQENVAAKNLRAVQISLANMMEEYAPKSHMESIAHSEGAQNHKLSYDGMSDHEKESFEDHFRLHLIGSPTPFPNKYSLSATNYYSKEDCATNGKAGYLLGAAMGRTSGVAMNALTSIFLQRREKNHNIVWVNAISSSSERNLRFIDHSFLGSTYQGVTKSIIEDTIKNRGLYEYNMHR